MEVLGETLGKRALVPCLNVELRPRNFRKTNIDHWHRVRFQRLAGAVHPWSYKC
jgi:hypothetical protein